MNELTVKIMDWPQMQIWEDRLKWAFDSTSKNNPKRNFLWVRWFVNEKAVIFHLSDKMKYHRSNRSLGVL
jgi:hypothetical protein